MKERIKQFYEDHPTVCNVVGVVGSAVAGIALIRKMNGRKISTADIWQRDDGAQQISIYRKNGKTITFQKTPSEV